MTKTANRSLVQLACAALIAGSLGGCGGGGGGDSTAQPAASPPTLVITSLNSDTVGRSAAVAALGLPISWLSETSVSLAGSGPQSASSRSSFMLLQAVRDHFIKAGADRSQALQVVDFGAMPCNYGGTARVVINDVDDNGMETAGDVETLELSNCVGTPNETYNGTLRFDVIEVAADSTTYNMTLTQLSYVTPNHSLTFNGSYFATAFIPTSSIRTTLTVNQPVTVAVRTHAPYNDTVTLGTGFVVDDQVDYGAGRNVLSAEGRVSSALAGGSVDVSTVSDLITTRTGTMVGYPEAGVLKVTGKAGALSITARSSASVCLDTDSNDDGKIESSNTQSWDWLL